MIHPSLVRQFKTYKLEAKSLHTNIHCRVAAIFSSATRIFRNDFATETFFSNLQCILKLYR